MVCVKMHKMYMHAQFDTKTGIACPRLASFQGVTLIVQVLASSFTVCAGQCHHIKIK